MPIFIKIGNHTICTVSKDISFDSSIWIYKSVTNRIIIPSLKIIKPRFCIVDIPPITEGIQRTQGGGHGAGGGEDLAPRIVGISYHLVSVAVNQAQHVALQIYNVAILRAVEVHYGGLVLGIVEEVQLVAALGQMDNILAMEDIVRIGISDIAVAVIHAGFTGAKAVGVVREGKRIIARFSKVALVHGPQLPPTVPGVMPFTIVSRIANIIIGNCDPVIRRHLVLPVGIAVSIENCLELCANSIGSIGVPFLAQDIAAPVIVVHPGGAIAAAGGVAGIVYPDQLAQAVVHTGGLDAVPGNGGNVVLVGERKSSPVRNCFADMLSQL